MAKKIKLSEEYRRKISEIKKIKYKKGLIKPWNKGKEKNFSKNTVLIL